MSKPKRQISQKVCFHTKYGMPSILSMEQKTAGYVALAVTLLVMVVSLTIIGGFASFASQEMQSNNAFVKSVESRYIAEGGIEDMVYRVVSGKQYSASETLDVGNGTTTLTVSTSGALKTIRSAGKREIFRQSIETRVKVNTTGNNFQYGVHVGNGGIEMSNTSQIIGSIYSNGPIIGENSPVITGDAFTAGTSAISGTITIGGNVKAGAILGSPLITITKLASSSTLIDNASIGLSATADNFDDSTIGGNAYYRTSVSPDTIVTGSTILVPSAPPNLPNLPMPISDAQLDLWEAEAAAGGQYGGPCPYVLTSGITILDRQKIPCDMDIKNTAVVILKGTLWVAGNMTIQNSAVIQLDPLVYGGTSGLIIVDDPSNRSAKGILDVRNSAVINGSGVAGSYVMLVSRNNSAELGGSIDAIEIQNTSSAPIYYVPHGSVEIHNSAALKEITAYKLEIRNSATVTYESGLANVQFSSGQTGGYSVETWQQVP